MKSCCILKTVLNQSCCQFQGMRAADFQVKLTFEDSGHVFAQASYFKDGARLDVTDCWDEQTRTLHLGNDKLQLTIVKPKQKGKPTATDDLFIKNVLQNKHREVSCLHSSGDLNKGLVQYSCHEYVPGILDCKFFYVFNF